VYGNARVSGSARVSGDAQVCLPQDILMIGPIGSRNGTTTFYRTNGNGVSVACGCFTGTLKEFADKVEETHSDSLYGREYNCAIKLAEERFGTVVSGKDVTE
jgi:hypothetical protein